MSLHEIMELSILGLSVRQILSTILLIIILLAVVKILNRFFSTAIEKLKVGKSLHTFLKSIIRIVLYCIAGLIVADSLNINVSSLVALFSVASLAVSLAIQGTLTNVASGVTILISKPFVVGDYVEIGAVSGTVSDITLLHTHLTTTDNKLIYIPNSDVSAAQITNYTYMDTRRVDLTFNASYDADPEKVKAVLQDVVNHTEGVLQEPKPLIHVMQYQNSSISYVVRVWAKTQDYWDVYFALTEDVKRCFDEAGIEMTYDHLNIHVLP